MSGTYEEIEHTADVGLRVVAASFPELLALAAEGMFALMYGPPDDAGSEQIEVRVTGDSYTDLLWEWLSTLLTRHEIDRLIYWKADVAMADMTVEASLTGRPYEGIELVGPPVKAVTFHGLEVSVHGGVWEATVIFDT